MYKLLLATDKPEIMEAFQAVNSWESLGFRTPRMVSTAQAAIDSLKKHHADGIAFAFEQSDNDALMNHLTQDYPILPIITAGRNPGQVMDAVTELRSLLNRTHADFSDDNFGEADMLQLCRHEFFRGLIGGKVAEKTDVTRRLNLLRSRMSADKPCVLVELALPAGDSFLTGRWHYGSERLEVALRNFFGVELGGMRILVSVLPDERIFLLACPMLGEEAVDSISGVVHRHAEESIAHVREYLDLHLSIASVRVLSDLTSLATNA
ncbi:MAG: hypothetical protein E7316_07920 [Clostridiales bacterium]|nr:hypothetical protein [Clostridiales bacterium]